MYGENDSAVKKGALGEELLLKILEDGRNRIIRYPFAIKPKVSLWDVQWFTSEEKRYLGEVKTRSCKTDYSGEPYLLMGVKEFQKYIDDYHANKEPYGIDDAYLFFVVGETAKIYFSPIEKLKAIFDTSEKVKEELAKVPLTKLQIYREIPREVAEKIASIKPSGSPKNDNLFDNTDYEGTGNKKMEGDNSANTIRIAKPRVMVFMYGSLQIAIDKAVNGELYIKSSTFNYLTKGIVRGAFRTEEEELIKKHGGFTYLLPVRSNNSHSGLNVSKVETLLQEYKNQLLTNNFNGFRGSRAKLVESVEAGIKFWKETVLPAVEKYHRGEKVEIVPAKLPSQIQHQCGISTKSETFRNLKEETTPAAEKVVLLAGGAEVAEIMDGVKELSENFGEATWEKCCKYAVKNYRKINGIAADKMITVRAEMPIEEYLRQSVKERTVENGN